MLSESELASLVAAVVDKGLLDAQFKETDEVSLVCEGGLYYKLRLGKKRNELSSPCVGMPAPSTEELSRKMNELAATVRKLAKPHLTAAPDGVYVDLVKLSVNRVGKVEALASFGKEFERAARSQALTRVAGVDELEAMRSIHRKEVARKGQVYLPLLYLLKDGKLTDFDAMR
jgi:hypothetical protein